MEEFSHGDLDYWVQATIDEKLVGWATFQREKSDQNAVYMNLLVVHPAYQKKGIGEQLVKSLMNLKMIPNLSEIHLLLRKKNRVGRIFYPKLGFVSDPKYKRDNFVDVSLLEGWTWKNPLLQKKDTTDIKKVDPPTPSITPSLIPEEAPLKQLEDKYVEKSSIEEHFHDQYEKDSSSISPATLLIKHSTICQSNGSEQSVSTRDTLHVNFTNLGS